MKKITFCIGLLVAALGALWLLQGLGIVRIEPILCFADCKPVQDASVVWVIVGAIVFAAGGGVLYWSAKSRAR